MARKNKEMTRLIKVILTVAVVSGLVLSFIHLLTEKPIQEAQNKLISESMKEVVAAEFNNEPFKEKIIVKRGKAKYTIYPARQDGYVTSLIMKTHSNKGYGGRLDVLVGFSLDGAVGNYKVIKHQETPGLGSKVNDESFKKNIIGKKPNEESFKVRQDGGEIDAITGATITSRALIDAIQRAYQGYLKFNAGNDNE
ncbi:MAG: RnfABCDGE type electron transport complex subunit G [Alphaproteobacteria bacterium]|nr:RnfABCDGE type electron transport complex subunit G [Alphaproteobacteria bacterium]